jgi:hypothetical protein
MNGLGGSGRIVLGAWAIVAALAAASAAGCGGLGVDPSGKLACGDHGECPSGLMCVEGRCRRVAGTKDAAADAPQSFDSAPADGPPADGPPADGSPADGGLAEVMTCPATQHLCPVGCVMNDSPQTCGTSCEPCVPPSNGGTAACDGTRCSGTCPNGKVPCLGACIDSTAACSGTCPADTHVCGQSCPSTHDVNACGTSCDPCGVPANAVAATCDGLACGFTCKPGFHACGKTCTSDTDPAGCGAACVACATDPNGAAVCAGGQCTLQCGAGYHLCAGKCVSNGNVGSCGPSSCTACPSITGGTATCDTQKCGGTCPTGQTLCAGACIPGGQACSGVCPSGNHNCSNVCDDNLSTNSCGTSCSACTKPTGANQTTCDGTTCSFTCSQGYHRCGAACAADSDATACGTACTKCAGDPNGTATCTNGTCGLSCNVGYHGCGTACVSNKDVNNCGASACGTACTAPTGGTVTCDGVSCVQACTNANQYVCQGACINKTQSCNGQCQSSSYKLCAGTCIPTASCCTNADCPSNTPLCNSGACAARPNGQACASGAECVTKNCVDGVCCDGACTGQCQACNVTGAVGTCSPVPALAAPRGTRAACGAAPCAGYCDGTTTASCHYPPTQCAAQTCSAGLQTAAALCDATGHCPAGQTSSCQYVCVGNACGGSCHPGTYQCSGTTLQYCNGGAWQTQATCSGSTPKCDANQQKCVPYGLGESCTSSGQCGTNACSWGVCCSQQCDTTCTNSCAGGSCQNKGEGTLCNTKHNDAPGFNDILSSCHGGKCSAPKIICNDVEGCDLTNDVCCGDSFSATFSCTVPAACPSSLSNEVWNGCGSSADCPTGLVCLYYFQDVGNRYTECVAPSKLGTAAWGYESCDPHSAVNTCAVVAGTTCSACPGCGVPGTCQ